MTDVITPQTNQEGQVIRKIRSFVRREGRLTKGQQNAIDQNWQQLGIDYQQELLNFETVFGNTNPVVLEIGFGMGASLVEMAKNNPDKNYFGIEVHRPGVGACLASAQTQEVTNLRVMCHDAVEVFEFMIPNNSLATLQLFFPDPWHKKRHHKRRIVQLEFAEMIRTKLKLDPQDINAGIFHMATDWENYAQHMIEVMNQANGFENIAVNGDYIPRPDERPLTKFESRGHRLGHGVWDIKYRRTL